MSDGSRQAAARRRDFATLKVRAAPKPTSRSSFTSPFLTNIHHIFWTLTCRVLASHLHAPPQCISTGVGELQSKVDSQELLAHPYAHSINTRRSSISSESKEQPSSNTQLACMATSEAPRLPPDLLHVICAELAARLDHATLYSCAVSSKQFGHAGAINALYR